MKMRVIVKVALLVLGVVMMVIVAIGCGNKETKMYESRFDKDKAELQARLQSSIGNIDQSIGQMKTAVTAAKPEVQAQLQQKIQQLDSIKTVLNEKLTRLGETTRNHWDKFKNDASKTIDDAEQYIKAVPGALTSQSAQSDSTSIPSSSK